jgi:AraC-like DNA-binding protein
MNAPELTIATSYIHHMASFLNPRDVPRWLGRAGVEQADLDAESITVPLDVFSDVVLMASELANEPALGLFLGERLVARTHGFVGYAAINSRSLRELLGVLEQYVALRFSALRLSWSVEGDEVRLQLTAGVPLGEVARPVYEAVVISLRNVLDTVSLGTFEVLAIAFPFPAPDYADLAADVARTRVRYDESWTGFVLRASDLDAPLKMADSGVFDDAARICQQRLEELEANTSYSARVRRILLESENGFPSLPATAHRLHMSPRTLHRRLVDEETSFRQLVDDVRFRLAQDYLEGGRANLEEIAFMLGYTDSANFRRAFRRWAGVPPSKFLD